MKDRLVAEVNVNNEKYFFTSLYRSINHNPDELEQFCTNPLEC